MITFDNFYIKTYACYKGCKTPKRQPDFTSDSGSKYWYGQNKNGDYVIRRSNHWGRFLTVHWKLKTNYRGIAKSGKCYLKDFSVVM